ncbi:MAG: ATP-binding protein [Chloroflexota bacterium]|nr:ATP-binding protein [Chloroflexota bacterium]
MNGAMNTNGAVNGFTAFPDGRVPLGTVVAGSLSDGIQVRLDDGVSVEDMKVGTFISIQGQRHRFLGVLTEIELESTDDGIAAAPPDASSPLLSQVLSGTIAYNSLTVEPMLTVSADAENPVKPAKTIPPHFSRVSQASEEDIQTVFGGEEQGHFYIGNPMDMEARLCLNIDELVKRSNGVFGKSGTGKTFLTRLLLIGILQHGIASNLIFDMHGEYGWRGSSEHTTEVKGLKQLFGSKVAVFSLDPENDRNRRLTPDYQVRIGYEEIEPEDVAILKDAWGLSEIAAESAYSLRQILGVGWVSEFISYPTGEEFNELAQRVGVPATTLNALRSRLRPLTRYEFMTEGKGNNSVREIMNYLQAGKHVVLEFGKHGNDIGAYLLIANMLTRRIHEQYVRMSEQASADPTQQPRPLVITIEEAHRFLSPAIARNTIFGNIAREMRKYNVTLLVVDQRPSGIDDEVMSQLGTKIACLLDNEKDTDAVLSGVSGSRKLRTVLARLESNRQALVFGHALPMPVVIQTREYGTPDSYRELGVVDDAERQAQTQRDVDALFGAASC